MGFSHDFEVARYLLEFEKARVKQPSALETQPSTFTPMQINVLKSKPASPQISSISEMGSSSAAEQDIDVTGVAEMSGVEEIQSTTSEVKSSTLEDTEMPLEDIPPVYTTRRRKVEEKKISSSFVNPFDLTLDCTCEDEDDNDYDDDDSLYEPSGFTMEQILPEKVMESEDMAFEEAEFGLEKVEEVEITDEDEDSDREEPVTKISSDSFGWLAEEVKVIVFLKQLLQLAELTVKKCPTCGSDRLVIQESYFGSSVSLKWVCPSDHTAAQWHSQPILNRMMRSGEFSISATILTSGNNYGKMSLWDQMLKVKFPSANQFHRIQTHYLVPTIDSYWQHTQEEILAACQGEIVVLGDGRNDSPGHCAQYCSYSLMDNASKKILTLQTVDKRMTGRKSAAMEKVGFQAAMDDLNAKGVGVVEVVTDAHMGIGALMKLPAFDKIQHSHDIWHVAKNSGKKLTGSNEEREPVNTSLGEGHCQSLLVHMQTSRDKTAVCGHLGWGHAPYCERTCMDSGSL
ncbi:uncharacterized protein LOC127868385 [Dreissena polymorpha]|uniref:uncharacterized protein LOC127868385 n=1 Tax=Dreissena polymorpha TaxID=45954 RepID=UPI002263F988|nr:uncharacterized protein LOC127868385 [Dreissena polymorpha]XP_052266084.1 uncharacterized protein LOC127868385 [Dreissena polymorpha]